MSCGVAVDTFVGYWDAKAPESELDYRFNWSRWLDTDTITKLVGVFAETGIDIGDGGSLPAPAFTSTVVTFWVSGGSAGREYRIDCEVQTAAGKTERRYGILRVE